ncbi:MAG: ATP-binding protein [Nitrospirota bacterium]
MIIRELQKSIQQSIKEFSITGILGSRQVGKTTLAKAIKECLAKRMIYIDLELPSDRDKLRDPELYLRQFPDDVVIIDEIQRMPELFPLMRALVDQGGKKGRFLILGSASPDLIKRASESLAGRIVYHELAPLNLRETGYESLTKLWLRGGYPESFLAGDDERSFAWREAYIRTYLEMDIPQLGLQIPSLQLRRFWSMIAHSHGQLWNASKLAGSLGLSAPTVRRYLDILSETFIARQIQPYYTNIKKRLVKSPKVYIRDSGLLHTLLKIMTLDDLQSHPLLGSSWEGFIMEQIISALPDTRNIYFYRTSAGAELDLLFFNKKNEPVAVEIKYSLSPGISKGFRNAFKDLSCAKGFIVYPGEESYPLAEKIFTLPAKNLADLEDV